jgi:hypothetical protein
MLQGCQRGMDARTEVQTIGACEGGRLRRLVETALAERRPAAIAHALLTHRRLWVVAAVVGGCLALPSLRVGLLFDDYHAKLLMQGSDSPARALKSPLDMFRFLDGDPAKNAALMDYGFLPWWTDKAVKVAFWRPVASLTHWVDYLLWPDTPALMHAQSVCWYALLAGAAVLLYQRIMGLTVVAGLAALLYCVDDAHAVPVGFLANRNAVLAAAFGMLCLLAHLRWRQDRWRAGAFLGPALLAMSLLAKEEGIATAAYLVAFAALLERGPWGKRMLTLAPYAAVVIVWRLLWVYLGYGVAHVGPYVDPMREPLRFVAAVLHNVPILLLGQLAAPPADVGLMLEPTAQRWFVMGAWVFVLLVVLVWKPLVARDRVARFWALGIILALIPACSTFPADRMLLFIGIGAMGLSAQFLKGVATDIGDWSSRRPIRVALMLLAAMFVARHAVAAPVSLALRAGAPCGPQWFIDRLYMKEPLDPAVQNQDLVVVNAPTLFYLMMSTPLIWASENAPMPRHIRVLSTSFFQPVDVRRLDETTLSVRPQSGFLAWTDDKLCRAEQPPFRVGQQVKLTGMTAKILAVMTDGRPAEVAFRFDVPLEDASLRWLQWKGGAFVPFKPPPVARGITLEASWADAIP